MSSSDRLKLIDELSLTISEQLDLREQLEIIKIIDPTANLNRQHMEFVIGKTGIIQSLSVHYRYRRQPIHIDRSSCCIDTYHGAAA